MKIIFNPSYFLPINLIFLIVVFQQIEIFICEAQKVKGIKQKGKKKVSRRLAAVFLVKENEETIK